MERKCACMLCPGQLHGLGPSCRLSDLCDLCIGVALWPAAGGGACRRMYSLRNGQTCSRDSPDSFGLLLDCQALVSSRLVKRLHIASRSNLAD